MEKALIEGWKIALILVGLGGIVGGIFVVRMLLRRQKEGFQALLNAQRLAPAAVPQPGTPPPPLARAPAQVVAEPAPVVEEPVAEAPVPPLLPAPVPPTVNISVNANAPVAPSPEPPQVPVIRPPGPDPYDRPGGFYDPESNQRDDAPSYRIIVNHGPRIAWIVIAALAVGIAIFTYVRNAGPKKETATKVEAAEQQAAAARERCAKCTIRGDMNWVEITLHDGSRGYRMTGAYCDCETTADGCVPRCQDLDDTGPEIVARGCTCVTPGALIHGQP